jgi:formate dehydrogenase subunit delta
VDTAKLVMMANQIARFFAAQPGDQVADTASHMMLYWEPRMRRAILDHLAAGGTGLDPLARQAIERLGQPKNVQGTLQAR